jgi:hypothetical protein
MHPFFCLNQTVFLYSATITGRSDIYQVVSQKEIGFTRDEDAHSYFICSLLFNIYISICFSRIQSKKTGQKKHSSINIDLNQSGIGYLYIYIIE